MLELDQPAEQRELTQRRYRREAEPSRFILALACALAVNALAFGWLGADGPPTVVAAPRVLRLSALRQVSKMASHAQRAVSAPVVATPATARTGGGRWFGARGASPAPSRGWAWWPARGASSGAGSPTPQRPAAGQPSLAGPANTWSGPLAAGGAGPVVGPVTRVESGGANGRDDGGPAGYGHEPASVGTRGTGHGADQPGGSPLAFASGRAVGDGLPGPASSASAEPAAVVHRGGGRPAPGGAVDIDPEPAPQPPPSAEPAASRPEPPRPAPASRPEPAPAARPEPKPEPKPEAKPEARPEPPPPAPKPEPKPDLPNTPRVLSRSAPSFPPVDKSGSVTIAIHVSASGAVTSVEVTSSSGIGGVDSAARSAGRRFRFSRAENGKTFYQTFRYSPK